MAEAEPKRRMTHEEYLAAELVAERRSEYVAGEVFEVHAMTGAKRDHVRVVTNLVYELNSVLRDTTCDVLCNDMLVQIDAADAYFYPDVVVTCDPRDAAEERITRYPKLLVEVLSPSTANYDRGKKLDWYRTLETLEEYVIVDTDGVSVHCYRRSEGDSWVLHSWGAGDTAVLTSVDARVPVASIYAKTTVTGAVAGATDA